MRMLLKKSKKLLLLVLALCVLVTCKSDIVFASNAEGETQTELVYSLKTSSYNIGNDTDGDGVVDDFGDTSTSAGGLIPSTIYNTWTDKTATKFIPFYATATRDQGGDEVKSDTTASSNGYVWARGRDSMWRLYPCYANNQQYVTTYDYQNLKNTMPWQWTSYKDGLTESQSFMAQEFLQVRAKGPADGAEKWSDGSEPYFTIKLKVPVAGTWVVTTEHSGQSQQYKYANLHFYMLPVTDEAPTREQLINEANFLGSMDTRKDSSVTHTKQLEISSPGEYYLTVKMDDDNWGEGETRPTGAWDIRLKSITLKRIPTAEINGTKYATLQDAISNATEGATITLLEDITESSIELNNKITLDLNGKILTATYFNAINGTNVIDCSKDKNGRLKVDAKNGTLSATNSQVPIYIAGEGYMFATMKGQSSVSKTDDSFTVISRPSFGNAYTKLAGGATAAGLQFIIRLDWGKDANGDFTDYQEFVYKEDTVKAVYNVTTPKAFSVTVNGLTGYTENMKVTVLVKSTDLEVEWVNNEFYMSSAN